jgi:hypothetical protein
MNPAFLRRHAVRVGFAVIFAAAIALLLPYLPTQVVGLTNWNKFSSRSQAASDAKRNEIKQELLSVNEHPWAGEYHYGDGLGVNVDLSLAPKSGFVFTWYGCLGLYDLNYGNVIEENGRIKLLFKHRNERKGFQGIAPELVPVTWGDRHYLIPSDGFIHFANTVNAGFETGRAFLLKAGDEERPVRGQPDIPSQYAEYLLKHPIDAEISSVKETKSEDSNRTTIAVLNAGFIQGVRQGMTLYVYQPSDFYEFATIASVSDSSSEARIVQDANDRCQPPTVTWKLSTHAERHAASTK